MKKLILLLLITLFAFGKSTFSDPQPSFENPRRVVIPLYVSEPQKVNHILGSIYNILKEYPPETLKVVVVAYGTGMRVIKKDYDTKTLARVKSLMEYDVEFIGCRNTMETMHWIDTDFIDDVSFVQAGIVEVIERQVDGYIGVTPY
ncbi:MAG: DsrE family protein [Candidatus Marinarcus sp.]|uniref:DsrE family protein n=1 Tax=Candidatus Marinarcus sp. TaxID=3100987 RepID=UPI003AFFD833